MKNILLLIVLVIATENVWSQDLKYIAPGQDRLFVFLGDPHTSEDIALQKLIGKRCTRYMPQSDRSGCTSAIRKELQLLDYDIIINNKKKNAVSANSWTLPGYVFIAFKKNVLSLLSKTETTIYLTELSEGLDRYLTHQDRNFSIWNFTLSKFKTTENSAMVMAALFQDTSNLKLHLAYLEKSKIKGNKSFELNKQLLSQVIDNINQITQESTKGHQQLFYPGEITAPLSGTTFYHFYVPLYLSQMMVKAKTSKKFALAASFFLNFTYEMITSAPDRRFLFNDPENIDLRSGDGKMKDILAGFYGASFGARSDHFVQNSDAFTKAFAHSTRAGVELMIRP